MTLSMTGFGLLRDHSPEGELVWEVRSVNQRFLDLTVRLPEEFRALEESVRSQVKSKVVRGKLECYLRFKPAAKQSLVVDNTVLQALLVACNEVQPLLKQSQPPSVLDVLHWPGVLSGEKTSKKSLHATAMRLLDETLDAFLQSRQREGDGLANTVKQRCNTLGNLVLQARQAVPEAAAALKQKIVQRIEEAMVAVDQDRLEQELIFWLQKMDVDEELDRLDVHLKEVALMLSKREPMGRRLDFIIQEMNREANTLGSKAASTELTQVAVEMKVLIEQIREQAQNIE